MMGEERICAAYTKKCQITVIDVVQINVLDPKRSLTHKIEN